MKRIIALILLVLSALPYAHGQNPQTLTGVVRDSNGEPVFGAVVLLEGNPDVWAMTDAQGKYSLTVQVSTGKIIVQYLGYTEQKAEIAGKTVHNFTLEEDCEILERAVVVGYGTMRESDITGSVTQVKIDEGEAGHATSLEQMLKGRAAGVQVQSSSGAPGAGIDIKIRGNSSFNGGGEPLYVVDGVIINSSNDSFSPLSQASLEGEETSGLLGINPQDIASMEILKDASATAIYGAMGANGVILITTKQAEKEKPVINFSVGLELARRSRKIDLLNLEEYGNFLQVTGYTRGLTSIYRNGYDASAGYLVSDADWQDYMMRTAFNQRYYFSVANRSKSTSYMFTVSYKDNQGIIKNSGLTQFNARLSLDQTITPKFKIGLKANISKVRSQMIQGSSSGNMSSMTSAIRNMLNSRPYMYDDDADDEAPLTEDNGARPDRWLKDYHNNRDEYRVIPTIYAEWKIIPWLTYKLTAGGDYRVKKIDQWKGPFVTFDSNWALSGLGNTQKLVYNIDNMLMFDKKLGKSHNLSGMAGVSYYSQSSLTETSQGWNIAEYYGQSQSINSAPLTSTTFLYEESDCSTLSFLARVVYSLKGRYIFTGTYRCDGSSKFAKKNKFSNFPSIAFAWRMNEEPWFDFDKISMLKFRLGWGRVGNQALSSYQTLSNYGSVWYADHSAGNEKEAIRGLYPTNLANPELKWETTEQTNAGIDLKLNKKRLSFTLDVYNKNTYDLLQDVKIPVSTGFSSMWMNMGSINNRGIEFSSEALLIKRGDFSWDIFGNISHNKNKITSIGLPSQEGEVPFFYGKPIGSGNYIKTPVNIFIEGQPMGMLYGIKTNGIIREGETGPGLTAEEPFGPGAVRYVDVNGDNLIDDLDRQVIGDPNPKFTYGFGTSFFWKDLSLAIQFEGVYGNQIANINLVQELDTSYIMQNIRSEAFFGAWTPKTPDAKYPAIGAYTWAENKLFSDRYIEDGSYLRLSSISLAWDVPISPKHKFFNGVNISISAQNVLLFTKYKGWDPDVSSYGGNVLRMGCDYGSYPKARSISLDLKLRF